MSVAGLREPIVIDAHGDPALAARLHASLGRRHPVAAVETVSGSDVRFATIGADLTADFEIGSISKAITGLLYRDALERGEIDASTTLGDLLPVVGSPLAPITLASLSIHRSGLPRLPKQSGLVRRLLALRLRGANPYGDDLPTEVVRARRTRVGRPRPRYSNLGFELLGHALASAASTSYPCLVEQRITTPLGLMTLYAPVTADHLRPGALVGRTRGGRRREPWTGEAIAPAGGLRAAIGDMARLARAVLDGTAPGTAALEPVAAFAGQGVTIGAAWITLTHDGRRITWHNGGTGGFRSWIGVDLAKGTAAVLLSATSATVDAHGFRTLAALSGPRP